MSLFEPNEDTTPSELKTMDRDCHFNGKSEGAPGRGEKSSQGSKKGKIVIDNRTKKETGRGWRKKATITYPVPGGITEGEGFAWEKQEKNRMRARNREEKDSESSTRPEARKKRRGRVRWSCLSGEKGKMSHLRATQVKKGRRSPAAV